MASFSDVRVEFRAYKRINEDACSSLSEARLMIWGSSKPVDLANERLTEIEVVLECRQGCNCLQIDQNPSQCPADLVPGVCARPETLLCRRACETSEQCYDGPLPCISDACFPTPNEMCADCSSSATDCDGDRRCVQNTGTGERFCALRCPPLETEGTYPCPRSMSCVRLGTPSDPFTELP